MGQLREEDLGVLWRILVRVPFGRFNRHSKRALMGLWCAIGRDPGTGDMRVLGEGQKRLIRALYDSIQSYGTINTVLTK